MEIYKACREAKGMSLLTVLSISQSGYLPTLQKAQNTGLRLMLSILKSRRCIIISVCYWFLHLLSEWTERFPLVSTSVYLVKYLSIFCFQCQHAIQPNARRQLNKKREQDHFWLFQESKYFYFCVTLGQIPKI